MSTTEVIEQRIKRIERAAERAGIELRKVGRGRQREFTFNSRRVIRFKPQGKGTMCIEAYVDGQHESTIVAADQRVVWLLDKTAS